MEIMRAQRPHIKFETVAVEDRAASIEKGQKVYKDVDKIIVTAVGGRDVVLDDAVAWIEKKKNLALVGQYDIEWVHQYEKMYALYKEGKEVPEDGTPIRACITLFTAAEIENCLSANIRTLEQLAGANEESMSRMFMMGRALKQRAQEAMRIGEGKGAALKVEALSIENSELKTRVDELMKLVLELKDQIVAEAPKRGRPPKDTHV